MLDELENRKRRRLYLAQSDCRVRVIKIDGTPVPEKTEGHLYDISQSGMRFGVNHPIKSDAILEVEALLRRQPILMLALNGKLVREHKGACLPDDEIWEDTLESDLQNSCLGRKDPYIYGMTFELKDDMETSAALAEFLQQKFLSENE